MAAELSGKRKRARRASPSSASSASSASFKGFTDDEPPAPSIGRQPDSKREEIVDLPPPDKVHMRESADLSPNLSSKSRKSVVENERSSGGPQNVLHPIIEAAGSRMASSRGFATSPSASETKVSRDKDQGGSVATPPVKRFETSGKQQQPKASLRSRGLRAAAQLGSISKRNEMSDSARIAASAEVRRLMKKTALMKAPVKTWRTEQLAAAKAHAVRNSIAPGIKEDSEASHLRSSDIENVPSVAQAASLTGKETAERPLRGDYANPSPAVESEQPTSRPTGGRPLHVLFDVRRATAVPSVFCTDNEEDTMKRVKALKEYGYDADDSDSDDGASSSTEDATNASESKSYEKQDDRQAESDSPQEGNDGPEIEESSSESSVARLQDSQPAPFDQMQADQNGEILDLQLARGEATEGQEPQTINDAKPIYLPGAADARQSTAAKDSEQSHGESQDDAIVLLDDGDDGEETAVDGQSSGSNPTDNHSSSIPVELIDTIVDISETDEHVGPLPQGKVQSLGENMGQTECNGFLTAYSVDDRDMNFSTYGDADIGVETDPTEEIEGPRRVSFEAVPPKSENELWGAGDTLPEQRLAANQSDTSNGDGSLKMINERFEQTRPLLPWIADTVPPTPESLSREISIEHGDVLQSECIEFEKHEEPPRKRQKRTGVTSKHFSPPKRNKDHKAGQKGGVNLDDTGKLAKEAASQLHETLVPTTSLSVLEGSPKKITSNPVTATTGSQEWSPVFEHEPLQEESTLPPTSVRPTDGHSGTTTEEGYAEELALTSQDEDRVYGAESPEPPHVYLTQLLEAAMDKLPYEDTLVDMPSGQSVTSSMSQSFEPGRVLRPRPSPRTLSTPVFSEHIKNFSLTPELAGQESSGNTTPKTPALPVSRRLNKKSLPRDDSAVSTPRSRHKSTGRASKHFSSRQKVGESRADGVDGERRRTHTPAGTATLRMPSIDAESCGLIQEKLWQHPFWLMVAVILLNRTAGRSAIPVLHELRERWPTPEALLQDDESDLLRIVTHLGLQNQRTKKIRALAHQWIDDPPTDGKLRKTGNYPGLSDRNAQNGDNLTALDEGARAVFEGLLEVGHIYGCGRYAYDSWRMFCRDVLRGVADDYNGKNAVPGFEPEWKRVLPTDKELIVWMRWMWLREGFVWDSASGATRRATQGEMEEATQGKIEAPTPSPIKSVDAAPASHIPAPELAMDEGNVRESAQNIYIADGAMKEESGDNEESVLPDDGQSLIQDVFRDHFQISLIDETATTAIDNSEYGVIDPSVLTKMSGPETQNDDESMRHRSESLARSLPEDAKVYWEMSDSGEGDNIFVIPNQKRLLRFAQSGKKRRNKGNL